MNTSFEHEINFAKGENPETFAILLNPNQNDGILIHDRTFRGSLDYRDIDELLSILVHDKSPDDVFESQLSASAKSAGIVSATRQLIRRAKDRMGLDGKPVLLC